jgi:hypothetical protein
MGELSSQADDKERGWVTFLNLAVDEDLFQEVVWRALLIIKRANPDFHFEVYKEGVRLTDGGDILRVGKEG